MWNSFIGCSDLLICFVSRCVCVSSPLGAVTIAMAVVVDDKLSEAWIGECRGGYSVVFSSVETEAWLEVLKGGDVTVDMFVTESGTVVKEDAREIWAIVLEEWEKAIATRNGPSIKPIRLAKILAWCIAPTLVTGEGPAASEALAVSAAAIAAAKLTAMPVVAKPVVAPKASMKDEATMSAQQMLDMEVQGVTHAPQLLQIYISVQLGRIANQDEYEGLSYQMHWTSAKGLKQIAKNPSGLGQKTLAQHLETAKYDGNLAPIDKFIQRTADKFLLSGQPVFLIAGTRLLSRWSRAKSFQPTDGRVAANYLAMYWDDLPGRGIPEVVDFDLVRDAEKAVMAQGPAPNGVGLEALGSAKPRAGAASDSGSTVSWGGSSSVSNAGTKKLEDLMMSMQQTLATQMDTLAAEVTSIKKGHGDLASRIGQLRDKPVGEPRAGVKCYFCEGKGHTQANCPELAKQKKIKALAAAQDDE